ncbi:hypothetical protein [Zoogloea ramigera]|uniref:hypothetical protein n=1 Tax=Zoogloea ramigera TaxID=350 RepID=UPI003FA22414
MVKNLNEVVTQAEFGYMVGLAQQTVSEFVARGVLKPGESAACWIASYCSHLREMAEARAAAGDLDLATERARLAREHTIKLAMQNNVMRRELAPTHLLEEILAKTGARVSAILDTTPNRIARHVPSLSVADLAAIRHQVAKASAIAAGMSLSDLDHDADADVCTDPIGQGATDTDKSSEREEDETA